MAGNQKHLDKMWIALGNKIHLDPPVPFDGHTYLGCTQHDCIADKTMVEEKRAMFLAMTNKLGEDKLQSATSSNAAIEAG